MWVYNVGRWVVCDAGGLVPLCVGGDDMRTSARHVRERDSECELLCGTEVELDVGMGLGMGTYDESLGRILVVSVDGI